MRSSGRANSAPLNLIVGQQKWGIDLNPTCILISRRHRPRALPCRAHSRTLKYLPIRRCSICFTCWDFRRLVPNRHHCAETYTGLQAERRLEGSSARLPCVDEAAHLWLLHLRYCQLRILLCHLTIKSALV